MGKNVFELGHIYTRQAIHEALGGSQENYLPFVDGRVVCGCFTKELNPNAPDKVLIGDGPQVIKSARLFASQSEAVPIFMKQQSKMWEYVGAYVADRYSEDPAEIDPLKQEANRLDVVGVLSLRKISP